MILMSLFAFDDNRKMSRITAGELIHPEDFDPEWVSKESIREAFEADTPVSQSTGAHSRFFALLENVPEQQAAA